MLMAIKNKTLIISKVYSFTVLNETKNYCIYIKPFVIIVQNELKAKLDERAEKSLTQK
ncbi:Uncharacterised protein [Myroides odoratus]|uniref:Uncharacterized protein n=1 Tax=Myroides odoratus TaxID=256 RepID=A0A378RKF8_MYROD|nr:Uncharacterised protein [Myroides odoratus]